jgi:purine-binding chemotaxis protein CheW
MSTTVAPTDAQTGQFGSVTEEVQIAGDQIQLVTFRVGTIHLGIDIDFVQEINRLMEVTPVPEASPHIHGVVNLRGDVVTVLDAHQIFDLPKPDSMVGGRNLILKMDGERLGVLVDDVSDILTVSRNQLATRPSNVREVDRRFVDSVYLRDGDVVVVVDPHGFLAAIDQPTR